MAKPNFQFEKRQRELAKKRKKEEKLQRKLGKNNPQSMENPELSPDRPESSVTGDAPGAAEEKPVTSDR